MDRTTSALVDLERPTPAAGRLHLRRGTASEQLVEDLRARIVSLELAPGTSLSRQEVANRYGVSQTPVRDATLKLEQEGLVVIFPQSKTLVSKIDVDHARETQFLRLAIELEVTRKLALCQDKSSLAQARRILGMQRAAVEDGDLERFSALDRLFHQSLCDAAGVGALWELVTRRSGHIDRLRRLNLPDPGKPTEILRYHDAILNAIGAGDLAATEAAVRGHLSGTLASVPQIMLRHPDYF